MEIQDIQHHIFEDSLEREHYLSSVIWASPGFIYIKDIHSKYIACNENFARATGISSYEEIIGKTDYDLDWGAAEASFFRHSDLEILSGKVKVNFEEQQFQTNGKTHTLLANKIPLYNKHGKIIGIYGNYYDITERKEKEKALVEAQKKAEKANLAQSEFVTNISHDLRTPLAAILGMTEAALASDKPRIYKETLEGVLESGKHLLTLVEDILNYARVQHDENKPDNTTFSLDELLDAIRLSTENSAIQKGLKFSIENQCRKHQFVYSDKKAIRRIITNLIGNAIKFTLHGSINISIYPGQPSILSPTLMTLNIVVKDTGIGMQKKDLGKIFDRFSRLSPTYITGHASSGLGLTIVQQLLLQLHGTIQVESEPGRGTTFHCSIPLEFTATPKKINEQSYTHIEEDKPIESSPLSKSRALQILVVDDSKPVRRAMDMLLKHLGAEVHFAINGQDALATAINNFDIVFMDMGLGDFSGIAITKQLRREHGNNTPIIALTANALDKDKQQCLDAGMNDFITKPILLESLKKLLKSYQLIH
mgnify:CR=1 FL=1